MKIKRFAGSDMRDAMRQVRQTLGSDAVILETSTLDDGVEISAAVDFDPVDYEKSKAAATTGTKIDLTDADADDCLVTGPETEPGDKARPHNDDAHMQRMQEEVRTIRCLLEAQLARLVWDDQTRRSPKTASVMRNLSSLGITPDVVNQLVQDLGDLEDLDNSWTIPLKHLVQGIRVCGKDLVSEGGVFAVVGPTGVGKTTTIAKLAARSALRHGPEHIALVTTDSYRIGAREQLETFGRILGTPVHQAFDVAGLSTTLKGLADKKLILIDTAGMSQRDVQLSREMACLTKADQRIDVLLALPANAQTEALQEIMDTFLTTEPAACILTKIDEAASLGGAFSVLIRSGLPLAYVANGQRVPEDLYFARARQAWLVKAALELMRRHSQQASRDYMADNFVEVAVDECA